MALEHVHRAIPLNQLPLTRAKTRLVQGLVADNTWNHNRTQQIAVGVPRGARFERRLHDASYSEVKAHSELNADVVIEARKTVANATNPDAHYRDVPVRVNDRSWRFQCTGRGKIVLVSRPTPGTDLAIPVQDDGAVGYLRRHLADGWEAKALELDATGRPTVIVRKTVDVKRPSDCRRVMGIDLGFHEVFAVTIRDKATGRVVFEQLLGKNYRALKRTIWMRTDKLQSLSASGHGRRKAKNALRRVANKNSNVTNTVVKQLAAQVAHLAKAFDAEIALEDLTIHRLTARGVAGARKSNRARRAVPYGLAGRAITSACHLAGLPVTKRDPYATSSTCSRCGAPATKAGREVRCDGCGSRFHRDLNAARNICVARHAKTRVPTTRIRAVGNGGPVGGRTGARTDPCRILHTHATTVPEELRARGSKDRHTNSVLHKEPSK